jgi:hypothetical protein
MSLAYELFIHGHLVEKAFEKLSSGEADDMLKAAGFNHLCRISSSDYPKSRARIFVLKALLAHELECAFEDVEEAL